MLQSVGLWTHTLLMLAARRAFHGPWAEDRYSLQSLVHHLLPGECPLLGHLTPRILWGHGEMHLLGDVGVDEYVLNLVKGSRSLLAKGWKPSLARYLDVVKAAREEDTEWHTKLYGILLALFMTGVLSPTTFGVAFASKLTKALKKPADEAAAAHGAPGILDSASALSHAGAQLNAYVSATWYGNSMDSAEMSHRRASTGLGDEAELPDRRTREA